MLNDIVDNLEQCGKQNIVQCCFHQARTGCLFFAVYQTFNVTSRGNYTVCNIFTPNFTTVIFDHVDVGELCFTYVAIPNYTLSFGVKH